MPADMPVELNLLVWSTALCLLQMLISVITTVGQVGLPTMVGNHEKFPQLEGLAGRAHRAHKNMLESLVVFAGFALVTVVANRSSAMTELGSELFFWGRLVYAILYLIGVPWVRTGAWLVSAFGLILMFVHLM
jgi:uncharacterized MAPEG superfamily protein